MACQFGKDTWLAAPPLHQRPAMIRAYLDARESGHIEPAYSTMHFTLDIGISCETIVQIPQIQKRACQQVQSCGSMRMPVQRYEHERPTRFHRDHRTASGNQLCSTVCAYFRYSIRSWFGDLARSLSNRGFQVSALRKSPTNGHSDDRAMGTSMQWGNLMGSQTALQQGLALCGGSLSTTLI